MRARGSRATGVHATRYTRYTVPYSIQLLCPVEWGTGHLWFGGLRR